MSDRGWSLWNVTAAALAALLLFVAVGCADGRTTQDESASRGLTLLQVDHHGIVAFDAAHRRLVGYNRVGRSLSEAWRRELDPGLMLDVACAVQCPSVALLLQDATASTGSRVEVTDSFGRRQDTVPSTLGGDSTVVRVFRWQEKSVLFLKRHGWAYELVARYGPHEITVPVKSATATVKASTRGTSIVVVDQDAVTVLTTGSGGTWKVVQQIPTVANAACIAPAGDQVVIAGESDLLVDVPSGRIDRVPSSLSRAGACAVGRDWLVQGVLQSVNGAPSSQWTAQRRDGHALWRYEYPRLGDVFMSPSGDVACIAFDTPRCFTSSGEEVKGVSGPVAADEDGTIVYVANDGRLSAVAPPTG